MNINVTDSQVHSKTGISEIIEMSLQQVINMQMQPI